MVTLSLMIQQQHLSRNSALHSVTGTVLWDPPTWWRSRVSLQSDRASAHTLNSGITLTTSQAPVTSDPRTKLRASGTIASVTCSSESIVFQRTTSAKTTNNLFMWRRYPHFYNSPHSVLHSVTRFIGFSRCTSPNRWFYYNWLRPTQSFINTSFGKEHLVYFIFVITHFQLVLRPRKWGSIHPLPHTPSWHSV
jgi:hypothetical protein